MSTRQSWRWLVALSAGTAVCLGRGPNGAVAAGEEAGAHGRAATDRVVGHRLPGLPSVLAGAEVVAAETMFGTTLFDDLRAAVFGAAAPVTGTETGYVRRIHGRTACRPQNGRGGNAMVVVGPTLPRAGDLFEVQWSTVACVTPDPTPARVCCLFVSLSPMPQPQDLTPTGALGCWLLVNADYAVFPSSDPTAVLSQQDGLVRLRWVPPQGLVGSTFFAQLMVLEVGANAANYLVSSAIEVHVGN